jgi:hypothetical protein
LLLVIQPKIYLSRLLEIAVTVFNGATHDQISWGMKVPDSMVECRRQAAL